MPVQVIVSGVGRSGTTALYGILQKLFSSNGIDVRNVYEPYLWRTEAFEHLSIEDEGFEDAFRTTSAISIEGMYVHAKTPLFTESSSAVHTEFIDVLFPPERGTLAKMIRGCGRLKTFLEARPALKVIHIVRNPLDVVNSVSGFFSFFGDEFHPSDKPRFKAEVGKRFHADVGTAETLPEHLSEVAWSAFWWRYMNEAALQTAEEFPDRCLLLSQEALGYVRDAAVRKVVDFCRIDPQQSFWNQIADRKWGSGAEVKLTEDALSILRPQTAHYWTTIMPRLDAGIEIDRAAIRRAIEFKYETPTDPPPALHQVPSDLNPATLRVRYRLDTAQLQTQLDEAAARLQEQERQLDEAAARVQERERTIESLHAQLETWRQLETKVRQDYDRVRKSRSWRYTRPLRGLADLLVGLDGGRPRQ